MNRAKLQTEAPVLAFFDIDGTLLVGKSSERRFFDYLRRRKQISLSRWLLFFSFLLSQWVRFGIHVGKKNKAYLNDLAVDDINRLASAFVRDELLQALNQKVLQRLKWHLAEGHRVVLLSGTLQPVAEALGRQIGVCDIVATECSVRYGRYTSSAPWRHPFGHEKLALAKTFANALSSTLASAYAYGDSSKDRYLMRAVAHPVSVCPDRGLKRLAVRLGWEIMLRDG